MIDYKLNCVNKKLNEYIEARDRNIIFLQKSQSLMTVIGGNSWGRSQGRSLSVGCQSRGNKMFKYSIGNLYRQDQYSSQKEQHKKKKKNLV